MPRKPHQQHFTDASDINNLMSSLLGNVDGKTILEPSVGTGSLLKNLSGTPALIDGVDIDQQMLDNAKVNLKQLPVKLHRLDYIDYSVRREEIGEPLLMHGLYDGTIANPPYGIKFTEQYRKELKKTLPDFYVRESYGLFLYFAIKELRHGGKYVFLVPDTFLSNRNHVGLRRFLLNHTSLEYLIRFPSKVFQSVNFGYGNLCIISGRRANMGSNHNLRWIDAFDTQGSITSAWNNDSSVNYSRDLLEENVETGWHSQMHVWKTTFGKWPRLGDLAECKTGIYTGDNKSYIGFDPTRVTRRLNGHAINWDDEVCKGLPSQYEQRNGLEGEQRYVKLVRGGYREFNSSTPWALKWTPETLRHYRSDRKARFQNSQFYFRSGLAVPMVSARGLSASFMRNSVFDQGVVGIFPHDTSTLEALLLYLNSTIASDVRNVMMNNGANNSANYLRRLPVPTFDLASTTLARSVVERAILRGKLSLEDCDEFVKTVTT